MPNNMNSGYSGYSMSNRAAEAYNNGEMPLSKWTKQALLAAVEEYAKENEIRFSLPLLKKLTADELRNRFLYRSSWHHTSEYANRTDFYSLDTELLSELTDEDLKKIIEEKAPVKKEEPKTRKYRGEIRYIEWSGTRNHTKAEEKILNNIFIEEKGSFYIITDDEGNELLKKKIGSNGTRVTDYEAEEKRKEQERIREEKYKKEQQERETRMRAGSSPAALEFYDSLGGKGEASQGGNIYAPGRKPTRFDYAVGLETFFIVGEHRLRQDYSSGLIYLQTWNGQKWIEEE